MFFVIVYKELLIFCVEKLHVKFENIRMYHLIQKVLHIIINN